MAIKSSKIWPCLYLVLSCTLFSFSGLGGGFVFDDNLAIVGNMDTDPALSSFSVLWSHDIWGKHMLAPDSHHSYRPFLILVFKLLRTVHDSPIFLRIFSIMSHNVAVVQFYFMAEEVTGLSDLALDAALLFATHPVHVEAVTAVVNMAEPLHCIFYIIAFRIYYHDVFQRASKSAGDGKSSKVGMYTRWIMCVICAILFKETGLTVVGVIVGVSIVELLALSLRKGVDRLLVFRRWRSQHTVWMCLCATMVLSYTAFRVLLMHLLQQGEAGHSIAQGRSGVYLESSDLIRKAENPFAFLSGAELVFSILYLHYRYMTALVYPATLCAEYSFDCIPSVKTVWDARLWLAVSMYLALAGLVVLGLALAVSGVATEERVERKNKAKEKHKNRASSGSGSAGGQDQGKGNALVLARSLPGRPTCLIHSLVWMAVSFVPASGVLLRLGTLLAERLLYVPSCGFCLILAMAIHALCFSLLHPARAAPANKAARFVSQESASPRVVTLAIWALYLLKSYHQNLTWRTDSALFSAALESCPRSAKLNLQVAKIYVNSVSDPASGRLSVAGASLDEYATLQALQKARYHVDKAKEIDPDFCDLGYQEALLQVLLHRDQVAAVEALVDNLSCKFTSRNSLSMLESMWEGQLLQLGPHSKDRYLILKQQGQQASRGGMKALAAQKYTTGSQEAIQHSAYLDALLLAVIAEEEMGGWLNSEEAATERDRAGVEFAKALEMEATILLRGGQVRRLVQRTLEEGQKALNKQHPEGAAPSVWDSVHISDRLQVELPRAKEKLFAAVSARQESFRYVRALCQSDEQASAYLWSQGADPMLVPTALGSLEEAVTSKLDQAVLEHAAAGDHSSSTLPSCLHPQIGNLIDYAALQELKSQIQPSLSRDQHVPVDGARALSHKQISNLYLAAASHLLHHSGEDEAEAEGSGQRVEALGRVRALLLKAVGVAGMPHVLASSVARTLVPAL